MSFDISKRLLEAAALLNSEESLKVISQHENTLKIKPTHAPSEFMKFNNQTSSLILTVSFRPPLIRNNNYLVDL